MKQEDNVIITIKPNAKHTTAAVLIWINEVLHWKKLNIMEAYLLQKMTCHRIRTVEQNQTQAMWLIM